MAKTEDLLKRIQELERENCHLKQQQDAEALNALFNRQVPDSKISFWFEISINKDGKVIYAKLYDWSKVSYADIFTGYLFSSFLDTASKQKFEQTLEQMPQINGELLINLVNCKWEGKYVTHIEPSENENSDYLLRLFAINSISKTFKEYSKLISMVNKAQELSKLGFWRYEIASETLYFSEVLIKQFDLPASGHLIKDANSLSSKIHPDDFEVLRREFQQLTKNSNTLKKAIRILQSDGSLKFAELRANKIFDKKSEYLNGSIIDVTEQYFEHDKLKKSEQLLRNVTRHTSDILIVFKLQKDLNENIVDYQYYLVNKVFGMYFGIDADTVKNKYLSEMQPETFKKISPVLAMTYASKEAYHDRFYSENLDLYFDILIYSPQKDYLVTIWRDVSLQVNTENQLRKDVDRFQSLFEANPDSLLIVDVESEQIVEANQTALQKLGKTKNELLGDSIYNYVDQSALQEIKLKGHKECSFNAPCLKNNSEWGQSEVSIVKSNWQNKQVEIISIRNIEKRMMEKEKLIYKDRLFTKVFENIKNPLIVIEDKKVKLTNNAALKLFNTNSIEIQDRNFYELLDQNNLNSKAKHDLDRLLTEKINSKAELEWPVEGSKNDHRSYIFYVSDIDADINQKLIAIVDNTLISNHIENIEAENDYNNRLIDRSGLAIWEWYIDTNQINFVSGWEKLIGYTADEFPTSLEDFEQLMHPTEVNLLYNYLSEYLEGKKSRFDFACRIQCRNGIYKWINTNGFVEYNNQDLPIKFVGVSIDFTKTKLHEESLAKYNLELKQTISVAEIGYWEIDLVTMMFTGSKEVTDILGLPSNRQLTLKQIEDIVLSADQELFMSQFIEDHSYEAKQTTFRIVTPENSIRYVSSIIKSVENEGGSLSKFKGIIQDVTHIADNVLQNKSIESTTEITSIDLPLAILTKEKFLETTNRFSKLIGYSEQELLDGFINFNQILTEEHSSTFNEYLERVSSFRQQESSIRVNLKTKYGRVRTVSVLGTRYYWKNKESFLLFFKDETKEAFESDIVKKELKIYKYLNNNASYGALLLTNDGVVVYQNQKVNDLFGYSSDELEGRDFKSMLAEHDRIIFQDRVNSIVESKSFEQLELKALRKSGKELILKVDIFYAAIEEGNVCVFLQNIDKYKSLYEKERAAKNIILSISEVSTNGIALLDHEMNLVVSNEAFASFVDSDIDRLHKFVYRLSKKHSEVASILHKFKAEEEAKIEITHNEGTKSSFVIRMQVMNIDNQYYLLIFAIDQSLIENKLSYLNNELDKYKQVFESSPFGNAVVNKNHEILNSNHGLTQMLGIKANDLEDKKIDQYIDSQYLSTLNTSFSQLFSGIKNSVSFEATLRDINRQSREVLVNVESVKQPNGDTEFVLVTIIDITKKLSQEKFMLNQERIKTINQIGNIIAHRFNNYLMSIYGNSYSLLQNVEEEADKIRAQKIIGSVSKVSGLTRNLLGFSENYRSIKIEFELNDMLSKIVESFQQDESSAIQFDLEFESPTRKLMGDPDMLHTAISNIIQNAIDALGNKGQIQLNTGVVFVESDQKLNYGEVLKEGEYLRIKIIDSAGNVDVTNFENIFDPFYTTKDLVLNAGLGLTTAKNIIQRHNGGIKLAVTPGHDTTFYVYLPLLKDRKTPAIGTPNEMFINKGNVNILLVDDEELVRNVTSELLVKLGYNIYSFDSGKESIRFYQENQDRIQLVLLDMHMPKMSGIEVLEELRKVNPALKVIFLSGFSPDETMAEQLKERNCSFIQKPISIDKLSYAISSSLK